ncbi:MAG: Ig-like domain-containing protein [Candidatus Eremiobacteraeota bacterium]|nr:Ig-like domain-containing protein [Candidatus Eremiobacteraeota bacterium]
MSPLFDPTSGSPATIPLPNDLLRDTGATTPANKGLVNQFPNVAPLNAEPFNSLRTMRGFSTAGNILIPFTGQIEPASVNSGSVLLVEGPSSTAADADTGAGTNATVQCNVSVVNGQGTGSTGNSTIVLQPVLPLKPATNYYVVVTNGIQSNGIHITSNNITTVTKLRDPLITPAGNNIFPVPDTSAQALEPLRAFYQNLWTRAEAITGRDRNEIPLVFRFGTQPLFVQLRTIRGFVATQAARPLLGKTTVAANNAAVNLFYAANPALAGAPRDKIGAIYAAAYTADNYISTTTNPTAVPGLPAGAPIGNFGGTGVPGDLASVVNQKNKPMYVIAPIGASAASPVVIFQHGITRTKDDVFAIANTFCNAGYVVVATDLVVHGSDTPVTVPATTTGQLFINLAFLRNSRDNIRQSIVNLYWLTKVIKDGGLDFDGVAGSDFSTNNPAYVGMSLGAIVGTGYTSTEWNNQTAVLNVAGGRISTLLLNSAQISPQILAGLAGNGVTPGTAAFTQFFLIAQTVVDDADPFNYAAPALTGALKVPAGATTASRVLQQEVINDQVVPNVASRDLARAFAQVPGFNHIQPVVEAVSGVPQAATTDNPLTAYAGSGFFQFPNSQHGVLLDPTQGRTFAVQFQVANYLATAVLFPVPKIINPFVMFPNTKIEYLFDTTFGPFQP